MKKHTTKPVEGCTCDTCTPTYKFIEQHLDAYQANLDNGVDMPVGYLHYVIESVRRKVIQEYENNPRNS